MKLLLRLLVMAVTVSVFYFSNEPAEAQRRPSVRDFAGVWMWDDFLSDCDLRDPEDRELFKNWAGVEDIKSIPFTSLNLRIVQKGKHLSGNYWSIMRFGSRIDTGDFSTIVRGNTARFRIESSFGATVSVRLINRKGQLYWSVIGAEGGSYWLPQNAVLQRSFFPDVRSITLESRLSEVIEVFGEPDRRTFGDSESGDSGKALRIEYPGLMIELCEGVMSDQWEIWRMVITGRQRVASPGVRIGMKDTEVERLLGRPESRFIDEQRRLEVMSYRFLPFVRFFRIYLSNYRVVEIEMEADRT